MNSIIDDLNALGDTADAVADKLQQLGIKGTTACGDNCPIYIYLIKQGHYMVAFTTPEYIRTHDWVFIDTPKVISNFIRKFDRHGYSNLEE
jgi:hypothetical protein